jgi:hypothetical protein
MEILKAMGDALTRYQSIDLNFRLLLLPHDPCRDPLGLPSIHRLQHCSPLPCSPTENVAAGHYIIIAAVRKPDGNGESDE